MEDRARCCRICTAPCAGDFKKLVDLQYSGLAIYLHTNEDERNKASASKLDEAFILHNTGSKEIKRHDYLTELHQFHTKCPECKAIIQRVRTLLDEIRAIRRNEIIGICEHCKLANLKKTCKRCDFIVSKFMSRHEQTSKEKQERFKVWLCKVKHLLQAMLDKESVCQRRVFRDTELERILRELQSPLGTREPYIDFFPALDPEQLNTQKSLSESKEMLEELLSKIKLEREKQHPSDESLYPYLRESMGKYQVTKDTELSGELRDISPILTKKEYKDLINRLLDLSKALPQGLYRIRDLILDIVKTLTTGKNQRLPIEAIKILIKELEDLNITLTRDLSNNVNKEVIQRLINDLNDLITEGPSKDVNQNLLQLLIDLSALLTHELSKGLTKEQLQMLASSDQKDITQASSKRLDKEGSKGSLTSQRREIQQQSPKTLSTQSLPKGLIKEEKQDLLKRQIRETLQDSPIELRKSVTQAVPKVVQITEKEGLPKGVDKGVKQGSLEDFDKGIKQSSTNGVDKNVKQVTQKQGIPTGVDKSVKQDSTEDVNKGVKYGSTIGVDKDVKQVTEKQGTPKGAKAKGVKQVTEKQDSTEDVDKGVKQASTKGVDKDVKQVTEKQGLPKGVDKDVKQVTEKEGLPKGVEKSVKKDFPEDVDKGVKQGSTKGVEKDVKQVTEKQSIPKSIDKIVKKGPVEVVNKSVKQGSPKGVDKGVKQVTEKQGLPKEVDKGVQQGSLKVVDKGEKQGSPKDVQRTEKQGLPQKDMARGLPKESTYKGKPQPSLRNLSKANKDIKLGSSTIGSKAKIQTPSKDANIELIKKMATLNKALTGGVQNKNAIQELTDAINKGFKQRPTDAMKKIIQELPDLCKLALHDIPKTKDTQVIQGLVKDANTLIARGMSREENKLKMQELLHELNNPLTAIGKKDPGSKGQQLSKGLKKEISKDLEAVAPGSGRKGVKKAVSDSEKKKSQLDKTSKESKMKLIAKDKEDKKKKELSEKIVPAKQLSESVLLSMMKDKQANAAKYELYKQRQLAKEKEMERKRLKELLLKNRYVKKKKKIPPPKPEIYKISDNIHVCDVDKIDDSQMVKGDMITPYDPHYKDIIKSKEVEPLLFKTQLNFTDDEIVGSTTNYGTDTDYEALLRDGTVRYKLSEREFIDKGWTVLPTEKIMRRMNIYKMKPANPQYDWFERHKQDKELYYDSGRKLADIDENGRGHWYYQNGALALDYYNAQDLSIGQRYVVYSSGEEMENGKLNPRTVLALFDVRGNGVVYDHSGQVRLKYNQSEGLLVDPKIGPPGRWKWHALNDPPVLQQVYVNTHSKVRDHRLARIPKPEKTQDAADVARIQNPDMLAIELDNFVKEKATKVLQKFEPFKIKMKAVKINKHFSLKILDQANIYLVFREGITSLKLNLGMLLMSNEIIDIDTSELSDVATPYDKHPPKSHSVENIQKILKTVRSDKGQSSLDVSV